MKTNGYLPGDLEVLVRRAVHQMAFRLLEPKSDPHIMQCDFDAALKGYFFD